MGALQNLRMVGDALLCPLMRAWLAAGIDQAFSSVPRPTDAVHVHADGVTTERTRVLLVGGGVATGWGVLSHDLALPGTLARALAERTERGVDLEVLTEPGMILRTTTARLERTSLWRYDVIVVAPDLVDAVNLRAPHDWTADLVALLDVIRRGARPDTEVILVGLPPARSLPEFDSPLGALAARRGQLLNRLAASFAADQCEVTFAPVTASPAPDTGRHRTPDGYQFWAAEIAGVMAPLVRASTGGGGELMDESERQSAVDALALAGVSSEGFGRVVALARRLFGTEAAAFSVVDGTDLWFKSAAGVGEVRIPRSEGFCSVTIHQGGGMVVADASLDSRFADLPLVTADPGIRFYAGYPVTAPDGHPIGAICVFDTHPRRSADVDVAMLRRLALLVEAEIEAATASRVVLH